MEYFQVKECSCKCGIRRKGLKTQTSGQSQVTEVTAWACLLWAHCPQEGSEGRRDFPIMCPWLEKLTIGIFFIIR